MSAPLAEYYTTANEDLAELIPPNAQTILEVGCAAGMLGATYKAKHPNCRYVGVELNPSAAEAAAQRLDFVVTGDITQVQAEEVGLPADGFDCIIYGDILEHLVDPWSLLKKHAGWLSPGGRILASVPNVEHWSVLIVLLTGIWNYRDSGILDRTHLRFFNLDTLISMFDEAGLQVLKVKSVVPDKKDASRFIPLLLPAAEALGVKPDHFLRRKLTYKYIVRAAKRNPA